MKKRKITPKEELFCTYCAALESPREAAEKSGFQKALRSSQKLLERKEIRQRISEIKIKNEGRDFKTGLERLAFGCVSDAVSLLFDEEITKEKLLEMNLFNIAEIKRAKGGAIEIKFFDRLKALEKLASIENEKSRNDGTTLFEAISKSAKALVSAGE